jgi:hypothetical protein
LDKGRDIDPDRAALTAPGLFTVQAAARFFTGQNFGITEGDFIEVFDALERLLLWHVPTLVIDLFGQLALPPNLKVRAW